MKPQQQTLSIRISDVIVRRLESARKLIARRTGERVSIADVAKRFLETARDDDIEATQLLNRPTETLLGIHQRWENGQSLSRPEWQILGYYLQIGCEAIKDEPELPSTESYLGMLEAFITALGIRAGGHEIPELDGYYMSYLQLIDNPKQPANAVDQMSVTMTARRWISDLQETLGKETRTPKPIFIGRILNKAFSEEQFEGIQLLHSALRNHLPVLFRIAARGHYLQEGRPVREAHIERNYTQIRPLALPPIVVGDSTLSISLAENGELSMLLDLKPHRVLYPLEPYPVIRDFQTMLQVLKPGEQRISRHFFGYTGVGTSAFNFRRRNTGVAISFSTREWSALGELMETGMRSPELQNALKDLAMAYGEI